MATVAQLAAHTYQEVAWLLVIEGWPVMWTTSEALAGSGEGSWIGTENGPWTVATGLELDGALKLEMDLVESGMPRDHGRSFTIVDTENHIINFFEDEPGEVVYERLAPSDDPAPETLIGSGGNSVTIWNKWIDGEAIGPAGERRQFSCIPGYHIGYDHAALDTAGLDHLRSSVVQQAARHFEGRPFALYLLRKDPTTGTWPSWQDQYDSGYSLVYWGTIKSPPKVEAFEWTFDVEGPGSWLCRTLNTTRLAEWYNATPLLEISDEEAKIAVSLTFMKPKDPTLRQDAASSVWQLTLTSGQTREQLAAEIDAHLQTVASTAGADVTFSSYLGGKLKFTKDFFWIQIADNDGDNAYGAIMKLRMHQKVWLYLGWDLLVQGKPFGDPLSTQQEVEAEFGEEFKTFDLADTPDPAPGYQTAIFRTLQLNALWFMSPVRCDNDGAPRYFKPYIPFDGIAVLTPETSTLLDVGFGEGPYFPLQLARPPADVEIDGNPCDAAGFALFRGSYTAEIDGEVETRYALAQVSWVDAGGQVGLDGSDRAVLYLEKWLDNTQFGAPGWSGAWATNDLSFQPVAFLGYNTTQPDAAHNVLLRLLLSSGTGSWSGGVLTEGDNAAGAGTGPGDDREAADLGLCIPADLVDVASFKAAAEALPGGAGGPLNATRNLFLGPFDSYAFIESVIKPRNWAFTFRGGRYGIIARSAPLNIEDVEVAITQSDVAGEPDELPPSETVSFSHLLPIDLIEVTYGANQFEPGSSGDKTFSVKALDPRAAQRRSNAKVEIDGRTLLPNGKWAGDFTKLFGHEAARWFAEPWSVVRVKVKGDRARDIWPGALVSYESPWPATRNGVYGMTVPRIGRVVSTELDVETLTKTCEILIEGKDPTSVRRFAPIARLLDDVATVEERHDANNRRLFCYADAFGRGSEAKDVTAFVEPAWSNVGGNARVYVWQSWDGLTWEKTAEFVVSSVDLDTNMIGYGSLTGTIWERRLTVLTLAPYEDQDEGSWTRALFGVVCDSDDKFGAANAAGFPWVE